MAKNILHRFFKGWNDGGDQGVLEASMHCRGQGRRHRVGDVLRHRLGHDQLLERLLHLEVGPQDFTVHLPIEGVLKAGAGRLDQHGGGLADLFADGVLDVGLDVGQDDLGVEMVN